MLVNLKSVLTEVTVFSEGGVLHGDRLKWRSLGNSSGACVVEGRSI